MPECCHLNSYLPNTQTHTDTHLYTHARVIYLLQPTEIVIYGPAHLHKVLKFLEADCQGGRTYGITMKTNIFTHDDVGKLYGISMSGRISKLYHSLIYSTCLGWLNTLHKLYVCVCRLWVGPHVQWLISAGEPSSGCRLQAAPGRELWHIPEPYQKTETIAEEDGDRHRKWSWLYADEHDMKFNNENSLNVFVLF